MIRLHIIIPFSVLLICCSGSSSEDTTQTQGGELTEEIKQADLPELPMTFSDGARKSAKELKGNTAIVLFQPDCDHCQREAVDIQRNLAGFKDYKIYFVSSATMSEIMKFAADYNLHGQRNVFFARTEAENIVNAFGPIDAPSIYLYSDKGTLIESFNGEVAIEVVLKYI